jgi:glycosyltransferase involved in cell wall biosynthesis
MRITALLHLFVPEHCAGSETTVHAALRAMVNRGHEVTVICDRSRTAPYTIDDINVIRPPRRGVQSWLEATVSQADLSVTHLDLTSQAMMLALATKKPLVHFIHNDAQLQYWRVIPLKAQLVVFNSHWIAEKKEDWTYSGNDKAAKYVWPGPSVVVHPVVEAEHYRCERGDMITLVNPTPGKGANTLKALARQMPDRKFLAVQGGYGEQIITAEDSDARTRATGNIEWMAHTPDIRKVFRRTKILLMPSEYESYGRVGIEAACAGIPTIAHPTPGLKEAFGDAGIFIDRNEIAAWYVEIDRLLTDDVYYRQRSNAVLALADSLDPEGEFDRLEEAFVETAERWKGKGIDSMKMWTSDRWIYLMQDGNYQAMDNPGRIPTGAIRQIAGRGTQIPEQMARENGWIDPDREAKAVSEPEENKALSAPQETKARRKKAEVAA